MQPNAADSDDPLLTTKEAAARLGLKPKTLRAWRCNERGPDYVKHGTKRGRGGLVFYEKSVIDAYRRSLTHVTPED
jgi:hypothetical protein